MKILTLDIGNAIRELKKKCRTNIEVGRQLGMTSAHVGRILSGKVNYFGDETWERIEPILAPYMPPKAEAKTEDGEPDFLLARIIANYAELSDAEKADLLAASEHLRVASEQRKAAEQAAIVPSPNAAIRPDLLARMVREAENPTTTPRGKKTGLPLIHQQIVCPDCKQPFFVPRLKKGEKHACPVCGKHVVVK